MASLRGAYRSARSLPLSPLSRQAYPAPACTQRRTAASAAAVTAAILEELETTTLDAPQLSPEEKKEFRPWKRAADREFNLPGSRYQYHPPKYNRGPLHPIQSPPSSDPIARDYVPGPFNLPRLKETYRATVASDLMTLAYNHVPPGTPSREPAERLRSWVGDSPYFKNRDRRAPRGSPQLTLKERDITFRHIPEIKEITIATYAPKAADEPDHLLVARMMLMSITGVLPEITKTKQDVQAWRIRKGQRSGVKCTMYGNQAYEFLDRLIHIVLPRIKEWPGVKGTTGDSSGNLSFGLSTEHMHLFPEIELNHDMYPGKMLTGCRIFIKTTATSDRHARLLMKAMGLPFYGELRD
ncbi:ribosomal protein L5 domain-containing protein [Apodospora peruviana]|uniref:Ribosomal protein L5 domain-containing protein n=1 Tax=Apodospora peruviana TaxID=516989 RepID=A0AAE0MC56_9PEZI|nr:ribosomal protein L5 domain-containing protein [Apodospora peruviana]